MYSIAVISKILFAQVLLALLLLLWKITTPCLVA